MRSTASCVILLMLVACGGSTSGEPICGVNRYAEYDASGNFVCRDNPPPEPESVRFCKGADAYFTEPTITTTAEPPVIQANLQASGLVSRSTNQVVLKVAFLAGEKSVSVYPLAHVNTSAVRLPAKAKFYLGNNNGPLVEIPGANWDPAPLHARDSAVCWDNFYYLYYPEDKPESISFSVGAATLVYFYIMLDSSNFVSNQQIQPVLWFRYSVDGGKPRDCGSGPNAGCELVGHPLKF